MIHKFMKKNYPPKKKMTILVDFCAIHIYMANLAFQIKLLGF